MLERLPVEQLQAYEAYTQQHGLPMWRLEMQLARIAMLLDGIRIGPGAQLRLSDYLIGAERPAADAPPVAEVVTEEDAEAAATALGFSPRNRKKNNAASHTETT